jgi:hypothetical protein
MAIQQNGNYTPSERIVSPGVFTRETSQQFLAQGVAAIGGVVVAPFTKGPGFSPVTVTSEGDLNNIFGGPDGTLYGPMTAQQYIRQQGQVTVVRVGGLGGYQQDGALLITAAPGQYARFQESGSFSGVVLNASYTYTNSPGIFNISGSVSATFTSGMYSGSTVVIGDVAVATVSGSNTNSTGSTFVWAHFATMSLAHSNLAGPAIMTNVTMSLSPLSACANELQITARLTGSYGSLNLNAWTDGVALTENCGTASFLSGSDAVVLAVLSNTALDRGQNLYGFSGSVLTPVNSTVVGPDFYLALAEQHLDTNSNLVSSSYGTYRFSLDTNSTSYLTSVFGTDPEAGYAPVAAGQKLEAAYTYVNFKNRTQQIVNEMLASGSWKIQIHARNDAMILTDGITPDAGTSVYDLTNAYTPFIRSQQVTPFSSSYGTGSAAYDLFKVHTLTDGTNANKMYKLEISNVKAAGSIPGTDYGSFSVVVRDFNDTDAKTVILERFDNLNLDVNSSNYVARRIGDQFNYIDFNGKILSFGDYSNVSKLIRVEMASSPWPVVAIPFGFGPYAAPIGGEYARLGKLAAMEYCAASAYLLQPGRYASGVVFQPPLMLTSSPSIQMAAPSDLSWTTRNTSRQCQSAQRPTATRPSTSKPSLV